jgi:RNA polymerase sigma factor (TIGR02999 family)
VAGKVSVVRDPESITRLLQGLREGQRAAMDELMPLVYDELRRTAKRQLARRRPGDTLDTSALVHEAYLKLAGSGRTAWNDRAHFFAVAATAMRHVIIDYALKKRAAKRGAGRRRVFLDEGRLMPEEQAEELVALHEALERLARLNVRLSRVVECRFFAGLSVPETAAALGYSPRTIDRDWQKAKAWLYRELRSG